MNTRAELRPRARDRERRPLLRSFRFWVPITIVLLLLAIAIAALIIGPRIADRALGAKDSLEKAIPLAQTAQAQILAGQSDEAAATADELAALTADAREQTDDELWKGLEWIPVLGQNLTAVRTAAAVTDDLVTHAIVPATSLRLDALTPKEGAIDLQVVAGMQQTVADASDAVVAADDALNGLDRNGLLPQVDDALDKLGSAVSELRPVLEPAKDIVAILPKALGADGPRNYLMMFQNNAESRGTGGNPAALVLLTADQGRISITQQASSGDFDNGRPNPIVELDPETVALYGDKIGRYVMDATLTPDFTETAEIVRAFWAESFGTPVDAVVSFDPVALSYLLQATGPVEIAPQTVDVEGTEVTVPENPVSLTADNAVQVLLNDVYSQLPLPQAQDAFFAASAGAVFDAVVSGAAESKPLLENLGRAIDESRLMYVPSDEAEAALIGETRLSGRLPSTNVEESVVGVYVNDVTEGKLDFYMQLGIDASSTQCEAAAPTFTATATLTNTLGESQVAGLAPYISPARFFPKGHVSTDLVLYGPVGASLVSLTVDGASVEAAALVHLGRPAVKANVVNTPGQTHTVVAEFSAPEGEYGALDVRHTPMVRETPVTLATPGCD